MKTETNMCYLYDGKLNEMFSCYLIKLYETKAKLMNVSNEQTA